MNPIFFPDYFENKEKYLDERNRLTIALYADELNSLLSRLIKVMIRRGLIPSQKTIAWFYIGGLLHAPNLQERAIPKIGAKDSGQKLSRVEKIALMNRQILSVYIALVDRVPKSISTFEESNIPEKLSIIPPQELVYLQRKIKEFESLHDYQYDQRYWCALRLQVLWLATDAWNEIETHELMKEQSPDTIKAAYSSWKSNKTLDIEIALDIIEGFCKGMKRPTAKTLIDWRKQWYSLGYSNGNLRSVMESKELLQLLGLCSK